MKSGAALFGPPAIAPDEPWAKFQTSKTPRNATREAAKGSSSLRMTSFPSMEARTFAAYRRAADGPHAKASVFRQLEEVRATRRKRTACGRARQAARPTLA